MRASASSSAENGTPPQSEWRFFVSGKPTTQGSKRLVRTRRGRTLMLEASRYLKPWREAVAKAARAERVRVIEGDVEMSIVAVWPRPSVHYKKDGTLRSSAPKRAGYADCDKLCRGICDALAGIAYLNDRQVASLAIERRWAEHDEPSGAWVSIRAAPARGCWKYSCEE